VRVVVGREDESVRFKAKIDYSNLVYWLFIGALIAYSCRPPQMIDTALAMMHADQYRIPNAIIGVLCILSLPAMPLMLLLACFRSFPEYYEIRENGLFIRQGWKRNLIPYATIDKFLPLAQAFRWLPPANGFLVIPEKGASFYVAPSEKERFLAEVSQRCPQLEQRETKYGLSLQQAIL
jgi:hypothetical protein